MPSTRPTTAGVRGPVAKTPPTAPSGYRVDDRTRFELQAAALYTGHRNLQGVIDLAVREFLTGLHDIEGFEATLRDAEDAQQRRAGIPSLPTRGES